MTREDSGGEQAGLGCLLFAAFTLLIWLAIFAGVAWLLFTVR